MRVLDGDTFVADAAVWPGQTVRVNVRIRGIDAPEMKARCDGERIAAVRARDELALLLGKALVAISNIAGAKYYGRVLADVANADGHAGRPAADRSPTGTRLCRRTPGRLVRMTRFETVGRPEPGRVRLRSRTLPRHG